MKDKKLYYFYHEIIGGTVFVDQRGKFVDWSEVDEIGLIDMAFGTVSNFFGVTIMALPGAWLVPDDPEDDFDEETLADDDEISSWCDKNNEMILEAIKQAHVDLGEVEVEDAEEEEFEETEIVNHVGPVADALQQREEEEDKMSKKKTAVKKKSSNKKSAATAADHAVPAAKSIAKAGTKFKKAPASSKAKKPAKKAPVKGSKPAKKPAKKKK